MLQRTTTIARELLSAADAELVALRSGSTTVSRAALSAMVEQRRIELDLGSRGVVLLSGSASIEWVVTYLALLDGGQVPLLAGDHVERLTSAWSPAAVVRTDEAGIDIERRASSDDATPVHPDLALLLSTSGSTGNPKLVRLSHRNLSSNARAIATYLRLGSADRGITTLPMHYCYGLSVLHSHLVSGASIVLSEASVVDPCFRESVQHHGVTNVSGVPHTFELLDQAHAADALWTPSLRLITQAGGKLDSSTLASWRDRAALWDTEFVVMYGQTEATARMAYLPPELADRHPDAIGVAIPGGSFRLAELSDDTDTAATDTAADTTGTEIGELVYDGPNVMLGYATTLDDLGAGSTVDELHTGDIARFHADDGVYEIVGRRSRFIKPFGLRIDLDALEADLRAATDVGEVAVGGDDDGLVVVAPDASDPADIGRTLERLTGLPPSQIVVECAMPVPRTSNGKIDFPSMTARAREATRALHEGDGSIGADTPSDASAASVLATVLGRDEIDSGDSFVSLGGDSLSYIECSIRLERVLGPLPQDWHLQPVGDLVARRTSRWFAWTDTTVVLRALAICLVVATHMHIAFVPGGAHLLLAVVGFNLSRFIIPIEPTRRRLAAGLRTAARIAVPTMIWVAIGMALGATYGIGTLLLANNYLGPRSHGGDHWHFWFIEVFVHVLIALSLLLAIPALRRSERRWPYAVPLVALALLVLLRLEWAQMGDWYNLRYRTHGVAWFVVLGWLVHRSDTTVKRLATAAICIVAIDGFFEYVPRERLIAGCLLVLLVFREIPLPRLAVRPLAALASASLWIYISHFTIWPPLADLFHDHTAYVATILLGIGVWVIAERVTLVATRSWQRRPVAARTPSVRIT